MLQPSSTRGGGRRKAVLAGLALCTHILAQSDPQVRTSAPLPRHTKLSQNSQQSGKPKRKFSSSWAHHQLSGRTAHSCSGQRRRCTSHGSLPLFWCGASSSCSHYMLTSCSTSSVKSRRHNYRPRLPGILSCARLFPSRRSRIPQRAPVATSHRVLSHIELAHLAEREGGPSDAT